MQLIRFLILILFFNGVAYSGFSQLKADFKASPIQGCAPMVVDFSDNSSGNPVEWLWDLGNGTTSTVKNPSNSYFLPGNYTIKLTVKDAAGNTNTISRTEYINVTTTPTVNFEANPGGGCYPLSVNFKDLSETKTGNIVKWEWDFGDGTIGEGKNPTHIYNNDGDFSVTLRVTTDNSCSNSATKKSIIKINPRPKVDFTSDITEACTAPETVNFINNSVNTGTVTYKWDFGDKTTSTEKNPSHTYKVAGTYDVSLIIKNQFGCADTLIKPAYFTLGKLKASFTGPEKACAGSTITFTNTTKPKPESVFWDFGDGTTSDRANPTKVYAEPGIYTIRMSGTTIGCSGEITKQIVIENGPAIDFSGTPLAACKPDLTVDFKRVAPDAVSFTWDFGDGGKSSAANPSHTYTKTGNFKVKLTAKNSTGCTSVVEKVEYVKVGLPTVTFNTPKVGCLPLSHKFEATFDPPFTIASYKWDFGDNTTSTEANPTHTFNKEGIYKVSLQYTTVDGCSETVTVDSAVVVGTKAKPMFKADPLVTCANVPVVFTNLSTDFGEYTIWDWRFGDGGRSSLQNPTYIYQDTGAFNVDLIVINSGCADTLTFNKYITIKPPIAAFSYAQRCAVSGNIRFTDKSIGADTWFWDFGDGNTSTQASPSHVFSKKGVYTVSLTVTNKATGCSFTKKADVEVIDEVASFEISAEETCKGMPVTFTVVNSNPANIKAYRWRFGDDLTGATDKPVISHKYSQAGEYLVSLTLTDINNCTSTIETPVAVKVIGPTASFKLPTASCINKNLKIEDLSTTTPNSKIVKWNWDYGDGVVGEYSNAPFRHSYKETGTYPVSLTVTDDNGCVDSLVDQMVLVPYVKADFTSDSLSCTYVDLPFQNLSEGANLTYAWNFGDQETSSGRSVTHRYKEEGVYSVKLTVTDQHGCSDNSAKPDLVTISDPHAQFSIDNGFSTCPPLIVQFKNESEKFKTFEWDFGDGNVSGTTLNPAHFYGTVGELKAILTVRGGTGCMDEASSIIEIKGPTGSFSYDVNTACVPAKVNFKAQAKATDSYLWDFNDGNTVSSLGTTISHTYDERGTYIPKLILIDEDGCRVPIRGPEPINIFGVTALFKTDAQSLCDTDPFHFTDQSSSNDQITQYIWNFGDGKMSTEQNPIYQYPKSGNYNAFLTVKTEHGCIDEAKPVNLKVNMTPEVKILGADQICIDGALEFSGVVVKSDHSPLVWSWDFGNGQKSNLQNPPPQKFNKDGNYTISLTAKSKEGCSDTDERQATIFPLPDIKVTASDWICKENSTTLQATGALNYSWTPAIDLSCNNCAAPVASPKETTEYKVFGVSEYGCRSEANVVVKVIQPSHIKTSESESICMGKVVRLSVSGAEKYQWSPAGDFTDPTSANPLVSPKVNTVYQVIGKDAYDCFADTAWIPIRVSPYPEVDAGPDQTMNVGEEIKIVPTIKGSYSTITWSPPSGILAQEGQGIIISPIENTIYKIAVTNEGGCTTFDEVKINVVCNNANVFIPNTFSPNGDGVNDRFFPRGTGLFRVKSMRIFSRWGQLVYEKSNFYANDANGGWDGTLKGQKMNPDVFVYVLEIVCANNQILTYKGDVTLLR